MFVVDDFDGDYTDDDKNNDDDGGGGGGDNGVGGQSLPLLLSPPMYTYLPYLE